MKKMNSKLYSILKATEGGLGQKAALGLLRDGGCLAKPATSPYVGHTAVEVFGDTRIQKRAERILFGDGRFTPLKRKVKPGRAKKSRKPRTLDLDDTLPKRARDYDPNHPEFTGGSRGKSGIPYTKKGHPTKKFVWGKTRKPKARQARSTPPSPRLRMVIHKKVATPKTAVQLFFPPRQHGVTLRLKLNGAGTFVMSNPNSRQRHWERS